MSALATTSAAPRTTAPRRLALPGRARLAHAAALLAAALAAFLLRAYNLDTSSDIFVDEITYLQLSRAVADDLQVYLYGEPFFLHPPAFFVLEGAVIRLFSVGGSEIEQIYALRYLNAVLAGVSAAALLSVGRSVGGWPAGAIAALFFTLDPFVMRLDGRNYLETLAIAPVLVGYAVLLPAVNGPRSPVSWARSLAVGGAFGVALLTKDMTAFLSLAPLGACFVLGWSLERRASFRIGAITAAIYAVYPATILLTGHWAEFEYQKFRGLARFTGHIQETGFNQAGGPSFADAILANLRAFAATYVLIAIGAAAVAVLALYGADRARLVAVWTGCGYAMMAYAMGLGTLEEQFFYFLVVPAMASVAAAGVLVWRRHLLVGLFGGVSPTRWLRRRLIAGPLHRAVLTTGVALVVAFAGWCSYVWVDIRTTPDNSYEVTLDWMEANVPAGARVAVTTATAEFLLDRYFITVVGSVEEIVAMDADYVIVSDRMTELGYSFTDQSVLDWLAINGELVHTVRGPSFGLLALVALPEDGGGRVET